MGRGAGRDLFAGPGGGVREDLDRASKELARALKAVRAIVCRLVGCSTERGVDEGVKEWRS